MGSMGFMSSIIPNLSHMCHWFWLSPRFFLLQPSHSGGWIIIVLGWTTVPWVFLGEMRWRFFCKSGPHIFEKRNRESCLWGPQKMYFSQFHGLSRNNCIILGWDSFHFLTSGDTFLREGLQYGWVLFHLYDFGGISEKLYEICRLVCFWGSQGPCVPTGGTCHGDMWKSLGVDLSLPLLHSLGAPGHPGDLTYIPVN